MPKTNSKNVKKTNVKPVAKKAAVKKVAKKTPVKKTPAKKLVVKEVLVKEPKKQKMVSFGQAVANFFRGYFKFSGTAQRSEYWWIALALFGPFVVLICLTAWVLSKIPMAAVMPAEILVANSPTWIWWLWFVYMVWTLVSLIPMWTLMARRLHDAGITAHILWISLAFFIIKMFIAPVGIMLLGASWTWSIVMLVFMLLPSKLKGNRYRD